VREPYKTEYPWLWSIQLWNSRYSFSFFNVFFKCVQ